MCRQLVQPLQEIGREVAEDQPSTGSDHTFCALECHCFQIVYPCASASVDHGKFATDLITCDGMVRGETGSVGDDIKIRKGGLDHDDVGAFVSIANLRVN